MQNKYYKKDKELFISTIKRQKRFLKELVQDSHSYYHMEKVIKKEQKLFREFLIENKDKQISFLK